MTFFESHLKRVKSWFSSSEELNSLSRQTSLQEPDSPKLTSPLTNDSVTEESARKALSLAQKMISREDLYANNKDYSDYVRKKPWIALTQEQLDCLDNTLDVLLRTKNQQVFEKSFQKQCDLYQKNLERRLEEIQTNQQNRQDLDESTKLILLSEVEQIFPINTRSSLKNIPDETLIETYKQSIPQIVQCFKQELQAPLDISIRGLAAIAEKKPKPMEAIHHQLLEEFEVALAENKNMPLELFAPNSGVLEAIKLVKKMWKENKIRIELIKATKTAQGATANILDLKKALAVIYNETSANPTLRKKCYERLGAEFDDKNFYEIREDLSYLTQTYTTN